MSSAPPNNNKRSAPSPSGNGGLPPFLKTRQSPNPKANSPKRGCLDLSCEIKIGFIYGADSDCGNFLYFDMPQAPSKSPWADKRK